jgi:hypothetical protein
MTTAINRASPTLGMALGYFIVLYAVLNGHIPEGHQPEAVAMAGVVVTNVIMEIKGFGRWVASLISKEKPGDK